MKMYKKLRIVVSCILIASYTLSTYGCGNDAETGEVETKPIIIEAPATDVPTTEKAVTEAPATEAVTTTIPETEAPATEAPTTDIPEADAPTTENNLIDGMRPEFKEAMDSYEEFFDEYCEFMKKYSESDNVFGMLADYTAFMAEYAKAMEELEDLKNQEMNEAETAYYTEVMARINAKLLDVAVQ
ncbi:MAG: hypothetical protein IJN57_11130 [Oscillospiraceae bacterium]|nr:hypothetical protein [Oscillospiraceae bacterium]